MPVGKIIELVGTSSRGFEDAINEAVRRSSKTVKNIRGVDVVAQKSDCKRRQGRRISETVFEDFPLSFEDPIC